MNNTKINLEYIKQFNPCKEGVNIFIKAGYDKFNGNIVDFIKLDKIPFDDIKWVIFHNDQKILSDNLMREFALLCSLRAVEEVSIPEITYLYDIALLQYISGRKIDNAAKDAAYNATFSTAYAAYSTAYADLSAARVARSAARYAAYSTAYAARSAAYAALSAARAARSAARYAAYSTARYAAYAADSTALSVNEENIQKEILIDLIENGLVICPERN